MGENMPQPPSPKHQVNTILRHLHTPVTCDADTSNNLLDQSENDHAEGLRQTNTQCDTANKNTWSSSAKDKNMREKMFARGLTAQ